MFSASLVTSQRATTAVPWLLVLVTIASLGSCTVDLVAPHDLEGARLQAVEGLIAYWRLDEGDGRTARDRTGSGHDGTLVGARWVAEGKAGGALAFDGQSDHVDLGVVDAPGDGLTIAAWLRLDASARDFQSRVLSKATGTSEDAHYWMLSLYLDAGAPKLRFRLKTADDNSTTTLRAHGGIVTAERWHHAAATYDGTTMRLYLDGESVGETAKSGAIAQNGDVSAQMGANAGGEHAWVGLLDEVVLMSRALDAEQLAQLMREGPSSL